MAKITLPTNYRDDILNSSAEGKRKYIMSYNQDGTVSFEDVTPYEQVGSDFGAGDINTANEAINESFDKNKLVKDLDTINALTEEGFAPDALAVKQLNESLSNINLDVVQSFTENDFTWEDTNKYFHRKYTIPTGYAIKSINVIPTDSNSIVSGIIRDDGTLRVAGCIYSKGSYTSMGSSYAFNVNVILTKS